MDNPFLSKRIFVLLLLCFLFLGTAPERSASAAVVPHPAAVSVPVASLSVIENVADFLATIVKVAAALVEVVIKLIGILPRMVRFFVPFLPEMICNGIAVLIYFLLIKGLISIIRG